MKTAFLFPGQGAQYPGMALDLYDASPRVRRLFDLATDTTKIDVHALLSKGTEEDLKQTVNTQITVTLANLASAEALKERGIEAQAVMGFSLGEYSALVYSGVLSLEDIFPLVKLRGEIMMHTANGLDQTFGAPGMAAVMGLSPEYVESVLKESKIEGLYGANYNSPIQVVVSGTAKALKDGELAFKAAGAKRVIPLKVSGPFHSPLMAPAGKALEKELDKLKFHNPKLTLFSNVTGKEVTSGSEAKKLAVQQVSASVRWTAEEQALLDWGVQRVIEAGPGTVLSGLWKAFGSDFLCHSAGKLDQLEQIH